MEKSNGSICVVSFADREPYLSWCVQMAESIQPLGVAHMVEKNCKGEPPNQSKRRVVREALRRGFATVYCLDADTRTRDYGKLSELLVDRGEGVHVIAGRDLAVHAGYYYAPNQIATLQRVFDTFGISYALHVSDWFVGYHLVDADPFFNAWDSIAALMAADNVNWGDGTSIGLAASISGTPVHISIPETDFDAAIEHFRQAKRLGIKRRGRTWR
jgi:hypothetical protein